MLIFGLTYLSSNVASSNTFLVVSVHRAAAKCKILSSTAMHFTSLVDSGFFVIEISL